MTKRFTMHQAGRPVIILAVSGCLSLTAPVPATTYYVDAVNGRDGNDGTNLRRPWATLSKAARSMASGDRALVRAGTYRETVTPKSGQTFEAYGSEKPLITGTDPVRNTAWSVHRGRIYKAAAHSKIYDVFVGREHMHKARWPNSGGEYLDAGRMAKGSLSGNPTRVTFTSRTPPNAVGGWYTGIHGILNFIPNEGIIGSQSGKTITVNVADQAWMWSREKYSGSGVGYITNHLNCLDAEKEWHWQNNTLYFRAPGSGTPANVQARVRLYGFRLINKSNVFLKDLYFLGASVLVDGGKMNVIDGCHFRHVSPWGNILDQTTRWKLQWGTIEDGTTGIHLSGTGHQIMNCSVYGSWAGGIRLDGGSHLTVRNNHVENVGWTGRWHHQPVSGWGTHHTIERNTLKRCSGAGIVLYQKTDITTQKSNVGVVRYPTLQNNFIQDIGYLQMDGNAFIYMQNADRADRWLDGVVRYNHCRGHRGRSIEKKFWGIYIDNGNDRIAIHHNVIHSQNGKTGKAGIFMHVAQHVGDDIGIFNNTIWGNWDEAVRVCAWGSGSIRGLTIHNNLSHVGASENSCNGGTGIKIDHNRKNAPEKEFVDVKNSNFRLKPTATMSIDKGVPIAGINDAGSKSPFTGANPDLGAYEHGGVDWKAGSKITRPLDFPQIDERPTSTADFRGISSIRRKHGRATAEFYDPRGRRLRDMQAAKFPSCMPGACLITRIHTDCGAIYTKHYLKGANQ